MSRLPTPDQVEQSLLADEAIIAQARARQMATLALADAMQLPTADGCKSMREWLAGRLDISAETAGRLSATARRLDDAPGLAARLSRGEISFDRAEAISRIPAEAQSDRLEGVDIQGLRRIAARHRRMTRADDVEAFAAQEMAMQPNLDQSRWRMWGEMDGYTGSLVEKTLTEVADELPEFPDGYRPGLAHRRVLALAALCEGADTKREISPMITVFVDAEGTEVEGGPAVGPEVLDKVACAGSLEVIKTVAGEPLGLGRTRRVIPGRLRRAILHRDGGCTGDGCTFRYRLEVHHIVPWSEGGSTDPDNLATLCWFHHQVVVHGWGYRIDPRLGPGRVRFHPPGHDPP